LLRADSLGTTPKKPEQCELRESPFCGAPGMVMLTLNGGYQIMCQRMCCVQFPRKDRAVAIALWNRRSESPTGNAHSVQRVKE